MNFPPPHFVVDTFPVVGGGNVLITSLCQRWSVPWLPVITTSVIIIFQVYETPQFDQFGKSLYGFAGIPGFFLARMAGKFQCQITKINAYLRGECGTRQRQLIYYLKSLEQLKAGYLEVWRLHRCRRVANIVEIVVLDVSAPSFSYP